jgi:hypothetical protein
MKWTNFKAVAWALETDKVRSKAERAVLVSLAAPADERGYTWPGKGSMASTWFMHHETVAGVIKALLVRRVISLTRQRRGDTKQVEVYRLPKCARSSNERRLETEPFKKAKDSGKVRKRFGKGVSNPPGTKNKEQRITLPSEETLSSRDILPPEDYTPLANASQSDCCFEWVYVYGKEFFPAQKANQIAATNQEFCLKAKRARRYPDGRIEEVQ